jgi:hypothetical protein
MIGGICMVYCIREHRRDFFLDSGNDVIYKSQARDRYFSLQLGSERQSHIQNISHDVKDISEGVRVRAGRD